MVLAEDFFLVGYPLLQYRQGFFDLAAQSLKVRLHRARIHLVKARRLREGLRRVHGGSRELDGGIRECAAA